MNRKKLHEAFVAIRKKRGRLTAEIVVTEAANPKHPLHNEFDWDDATAAHAQRLDRASRLIRMVKIKVVTASGEFSARRWHAVQAAGVVDAPDGYLPTEDVAANPIYQQALLQQMDRDWRALMDRYQHMKEFWPMVRKALRPKRKRKSA